DGDLELRVLIPRKPRQQNAASVWPCPGRKTSQIVGYCGSVGRCCAREPATSVATKGRDLPASAGTDEQVVMSVTIQIQERRAGSQLAELFPQQRLAGVIVEEFFVMRVVQEHARVGKQR